MVDPFAPVTRPISPIRTDDLLFRVRWFLLLLAVPMVWLELGTITLSIKLLAWLVLAGLLNLLIGLALQFPDLAKRLALPSLICDTILFALLPFVAIGTTNLPAYLMIFPAIIAATRFGPLRGLVVTTILALALIGRYFIPLEVEGARELLPTLLPLFALFATTLLSGYLTKQEKEEAVKQVTQELAELRGAMAGARLLYETTDLLNITTSYKPVLESMLEAGVRGLPEARREDGPPVGIAILFDDQDAEQRLAIVASRNIERRDERVHLPGKVGVIAEAFQSGNSVVFDRADQDPELAMLGAFMRCRAGVCYPLRAGMDLYGAVILSSPAPRRPPDQHLELMQAFTSQAGIAFQNAKLYQVSRKEQDRIVRNETEMRQKLARDLHDGPTQKVAGLVMQLDYINKLIDSNLPEAKKELEQARETAQQAAKEIRTALFTLRPLVLESKGLSAALEQYGERLRDVERLPIQMVPGDFGTELDQTIAFTVFQIIEEAVGNARKHAPNAPILASVQRKQNSLVAVIQDQGPGFDVEKTEAQYDKRTSLGLQNMRERARLIDANLTVLSAPGHGTRITLAVPLSSDSPDGKKA